MREASAGRAAHYDFADRLNKTFLGEIVIRAAYNQLVSPMAKKTAIVKETVAAAPKARAAKPKAPRVKAAQHSKVVSSEPVAPHAVSENASEVIAQIAYGYWEARGRQAGSPLEDWIRAEHEYRQRIGSR